LEEPPKHAIFILATTEVQKMLPTIISRCQRFDFRLLKVHEIAGKLKKICKKESIEAEKGTMDMIAVAARGSIRDAEGLLDQEVTFAGQDKKIEIVEVKEVLGIIETKLISQFADLIFQKRQKEAIDFLHIIQEKGVGLEEFAETFINYLRQALILKIGGEKQLLSFRITDSEIKSLQSRVQEITKERILKIIELFLKAANQEKYSPISGLSFEMAILSACEND
jgi:DNA polymerase-3 subunit gamma/tau